MINLRHILACFYVKVLYFFLRHIVYLFLNQVEARLLVRYLGAYSLPRGGYSGSSW